MNLLEMSFFGAVFIIAVLIIWTASINHLPKKNICYIMGNGTFQTAGSVSDSVHVQHIYTC